MFSKRCERGVSEVRFKKTLDSFTLETSLSHIIRIFLRNGRVRVEVSFDWSTLYTCNKIGQLRFFITKYSSLNNACQIWSSPSALINHRVYHQSFEALPLSWRLKNTSLISVPWINYTDLPLQTDFHDLKIRHITSPKCHWRVSNEVIFSGFYL